MPTKTRTSAELVLLLETQLGQPLPTFPSRLPKTRDIRRASHVCQAGWNEFTKDLPDCGEATEYSIGTVLQAAPPQAVYWLFRKLSTVDRFREKWAAPVRAALIVAALTEVYKDRALKATDRSVAFGFAVAVLRGDCPAYGRGTLFGNLLQATPSGALKTLVYAGSLRDPDPTQLKQGSFLQAAQALGAA